MLSIDFSLYWKPGQWILTSGFDAHYTGVYAVWLQLWIIAVEIEVRT